MTSNLPRLVVSSLLILVVAGACVGGGRGPSPAPPEPQIGQDHNLPGLSSLPSGAGLPIRGDGDDYFSCNLAGALTVNAGLAYSPADGTLKLYLLNSSGSVVDSDTAGNPGLRSVSAALGAGTAYLRVACASGGSDYALDASTSP